MDTTILSNKFEAIGARVKVRERPTRPRWNAPDLLRLDIGEDRRGEYFEITPPRNSETPRVDVLDVRPADRHLLLLVREDGNKNKYLCGHDERHWFVAGLPDGAPVGNVRQAMESLQPAAVQEAVSKKRVSSKARNRRKNAAFLRQGEWFFLPVDNMRVAPALVLKNEPMRRSSGGKPHWAEFCYRTGGETVYVSPRRPAGLTSVEYKKLVATNPRAKSWNWQAMQRNPGVYVQGKIRHADHATLCLRSWHRVVMNTEDQSAAMRNVAFLD
ncbi:MAG: hypothetical protein Aurels2KO_15770 [Aureliella sp.]